MVSKTQKDLQDLQVILGVFQELFIQTHIILGTRAMFSFKNKNITTEYRPVNTGWSNNTKSVRKLEKTRFIFDGFLLHKSVCWNGVLRRHFLGIEMQHWNKCLKSLFKDFVSFWSTLSTPSQRDAWKKLKIPKVGKGCSNLASFYGSHIDGIVYVKQISLGLARTLKKY